MIDTQEFNSNPLDGPKNMLWLTGKYGGFNDADDDTVPGSGRMGRGRRRVAGQLRAGDTAAEPGQRPGPRVRLHRQPAVVRLVGIGELGLDLRSDPHLPDALQQRHLDRSAAGVPHQCRWHARQRRTAADSTAKPHGTRPSSCRPGTRGRSSRATRPARKVAFRWGSLDATRQTQLDSQAMLEYLRGNGTNEGNAAGKFRPRVVEQAGRHRLLGAAVRRPAAVPLPRQPGRNRQRCLRDLRRRERHRCRAHADGLRRRERRHAAWVQCQYRRRGVCVHPDADVEDVRIAGPRHASPSWRNRTMCTSTSSTVRRAWATRTGAAPGTRSSPAA